MIEEMDITEEDMAEMKARIAAHRKTRGRTTPRLEGSDAMFAAGDAARARRERELTDPQYAIAARMSRAN